MKPYYEDQSCKIYHGDCLELLPALDEFFAVVTDPPYGMNCNTDSTRFSGGKFGAARYRSMGKEARPIHGDAAPFDPTPLLRFQSVVMFGANHYASRLPVGTWLVWQKKPPERFGTFLSDAELAWMKGGCGVYCKFIQWEGCCRGSDGHINQHPSQKPTSLMAWCITQSAENLAVILDPYMGSGTTLRAAKDLGRKAIGIEIEERYCEIAAKRLQQEVLPLKFTDSSNQSVQTALAFQDHRHAESQVQAAK